MKKFYGLELFILWFINNIQVLIYFSSEGYRWTVLCQWWSIRVHVVYWQTNARGSIKFQETHLAACKYIWTHPTCSGTVSNVEYPQFIDLRPSPSSEFLCLSGHRQCGPHGQSTTAGSRQPSLHLLQKLIKSCFHATQFHIPTNRPKHANGKPCHETISTFSLYV